MNKPLVITKEELKEKELKKSIEEKQKAIDENKIIEKNVTE